MTLIFMLHGSEPPKPGDCSMPIRVSVYGWPPLMFRAMMAVFQGNRVRRFYEHPSFGWLHTYEDGVSRADV